MASSSARHKTVHHLSQKAAAETFAAENGWIESIAGLAENSSATALLRDPVSCIPSFYFTLLVMHADDREYLMPSLLPDILSVGLHVKSTLEKCEHPRLTGVCTVAGQVLCCSQACRKRPWARGNEQRGAVQGNSGPIFAAAPRRGGVLLSGSALASGIEGHSMWDGMVLRVSMMCVWAKRG